MTHASDETQRFADTGTSEQMRAWGAYAALAMEVMGDVERAEAICEMIMAVGMRDAKPSEQREEFVKLLFG